MISMIRLRILQEVRQPAILLPLNWYPVRNVVIGLNYIYMNNDKYANL